MQDISFLTNTLHFLLASIIVVVLLYKLKLSPVLGYLIVGALINNYNWIEEQEYAHQLADFGIIFLLFMIGIELSFDRLMKMRLHVFGFGSLQIMITSAIISIGISYWFSLNIITSIVIGLSLALSSTAIVLQVLNESGHQYSQVGRLSLSTLLMQDFTVVPILAVLPFLAKNTDDNLLVVISLVALKALSAICFITILARLFLRPFFSLIASIKVEEVYVTTALFIALGTAWLTHKMNLSTAMGGFIAGILIAETEYRNKIEKIISPFHGLFMGLFFISIGMSIDIDFIREHLNVILLAASILIFVKSFIIFSLCKIFRFQWGASIHASLILAQGGEFAFILFDLAAKQGVINITHSKFGLMTVAISMAITPLLAIIGTKIENRLDKIEEIDSNNEYIGIKDLNNHIIIAGFGKVARIIAYMLEKEQINYIGVDNKMSLVKIIKKLGYPIFHGDINNKNTLTALGITRSKSIIITIDDKNTVKKIVKMVKKTIPDIDIICYGKNDIENKELITLGAKIVVPQQIELGLKLGEITLKNLDSAKHNIIDIKHEIRKDKYKIINNSNFFS